MTRLIWDIFNAIRIRRNTLAISKVKDDITSEVRADENLHRDLYTLTLITEAMWELVSERTGLGEVDLLAKMEEIDLRDGTRDNKSSKIKPCNACGRRINPARGKCIFCGNDSILESAFEKISS